MGFDNLFPRSTTAKGASRDNRGALGQPDSAYGVGMPRYTDHPNRRARSTAVRSSLDRHGE